MSWGQRFRASPEGARARALLVVESVCVPVWVLTGEATALLVAVLAGAAVIALVLLPDRSQSQRHVR